MFLCAENDSLLEIPVNTLAEGFTHLMAAYYVFDVSMCTQNVRENVVIYMHALDTMYVTAWCLVS